MQEFNKGVYDYIIASDENASKGEHDAEDSDEEENAAEGEDECQYILIFHSCC